MPLSTVAQRKQELFKLLIADKVQRIVLFGESGVGKTWTAREMSILARKKGLIDIVLWVFLNRQHDRASLCDSIAHQLSLLSTTGESEVEDENEESENPGDLQQHISAAIAGMRLLIVLDDEGNKMSEQQIMSELGMLLNINQQNYKILITKRINSEEINGSEIEVKPLSKGESLSLLQKRVGTEVYEVPGITALAKAFIEKSKNLPAAIVLMAKAFNFFAKQDNGVQKLERSLEEVSGNEIYNITHLLRSGYDLLPNRVLIDCCCGGSHFFRDCQHIHYNELIAYWMREGYLGHINCMEEAYERGHQVLMELLDCQILKKVEPNYVAMEGLMLNLDDIVMERSVMNFSDCHHCGFGGTASLGLANVFGDGNQHGLGRITQKDGVMKTLWSRKQGDDIIPNSFEEAPSLADLIKETGVDKLFSKLEAPPPIQSNFPSDTSSNEAATHIQKGLITSLQLMEDVDSMIAISNGVFTVLKILSVDFTSLYEKVKMFIGCSAMKTLLADSSASDSSIAELELEYQERKFHFDKISNDHEELCASITKSNTCMADLDKKIIQTRESLKQLEHELSFAHAERTSFTNDLAQISENISKSKEDLQDALEAMSQCKKKNLHHDAVERAFDRAKTSLNE